jgi:nitrate reductase cytochrome c-type subunit
MLKSIFTFLAVCFLATTIIAQDAPKYVGAKKCAGACHKKEKQGEQYKKWEEGPHSKAYINLKAADAEAVNNEACLKCHATAAGVDASLLEETFNIEDGVQCEACHGPGSEYKPMKIMKDREKSIEKGLVVWADEAAIKEMCLTCHDVANKTEGHPEPEEAFNFETMYPTVAHPIPEKK